MAGYKINSESAIDKQMRTVQFFSVYFKNFKAILLSNIMFFIVGFCGLSFFLAIIF